MRRLLIVAVVVLAGCGSSSSESANTSESASAATTEATPEATVAETIATTAAPDDTFSTEVLPIIEQTCARCHTGEGPGTAHFTVDTAADLVASAAELALITTAEVMPPWPASDEGGPYVGDWSLSAEEIEAISRWHAEGAVLDIDPTTAITASEPVLRLTDHNAELTPSVGYDGVAGQPDEYRCLIYDPELTEPAAMEAYELVPDNLTVVHHAIGHLVPASEREAADKRDGADGEGGGWTCFGGPGLDGAKSVIGWTPGAQPRVYPEGSGLVVQPGDFFVIQLHYHFEDDAPEDFTSLRVRWSDDLDVTPIQSQRFLAPAEIPCATWESGPLCDREAAHAALVEKYGQSGVQANALNRLCGKTPEDFAHMVDGIADSSCTLPFRVDGTIVSILGHMHEIGSSLRMTLNPGQPDEQILLDIPTWDFEWQLYYRPVTDIVVERGDWIQLDCSWDRSKIDPDVEPAYVLWADGTNDEMCFASIAVA